MSPDLQDCHAIGEIAAGYADGCLTREQTVLIAYHRGRMAPDHGLSGGIMAAVGLGVAAAEARIAKAGLADTGVVVACDNSPDSVTMSGELSTTLRLRSICVHFSVLVACHSYQHTSPVLKYMFSTGWLMQRCCAWTPPAVHKGKL